ncbi:MAG: ribonuclease PH [Duodenibacillus sp.]|nr:ribonuclease PH [Duodenibacillus sp.]
MRHDGRGPGELRAVAFERRYTCHAEGSVLVTCGRTKVICTATVTPGVPRWMKDRGEGWVTAEYGLLPRATGARCEREAARGKQSGRTQEIQRLIGRSLRGVVDRAKLGEYTLQIDCDVIQADGGTRCASISGAWVALADAVDWMLAQGLIAESPLTAQVAAVSAGMVGGRAVLDLDYAEDSGCDTDLNVVMTSGGDFVEVQGTAEGAGLKRAELEALLDLAETGCRRIMQLQREALAR